MVTSPFSDARSLYQICTTNQTKARLYRPSLFIQPNTEGLHLLSLVKSCLAYFSSQAKTDQPTKQTL